MYLCTQKEGNLIEICQSINQSITISTRIRYLLPAHFH